MLTIGIDPGTATTGYGFVQLTQNGELELVDFGVITTPSDMPMSDRLQQLHSQLSQLLVLHRPSSGAVEKLYFQRNVSTAISVGQARGVTLLALAEAGVQVAEYTPREIKQAIVGYGGAEKKQIQQMVRTLLEMESIPQPDDAADALAIAICHLHSMPMRGLLEDSS
ncbi:MAG: crossover junction endodeoxyribonuclease RuvC [Anaerolineae bacterium SM23_ 63]|nr:MAG: crossover junction endodeoxyribonuclease RuvC [Anaerolineae bacterium SM23_ 63]